MAAVKLLETAGCEVGVPASQTCCGQPAYNSGDKATTMAIAKATIAAFEPYDYVVAPSGSCAGMLKKHYPALLVRDAEFAARAAKLAGRTFELISFLTDVRGMTAVEARFDGSVTYHDSCSGLRELGIKDQPRRLLSSVKGLTLKEMEDSETCCGFGGTFALKYSDVSNAIVEKKAANIEDARADLLLAGDLGCLMNMVGKLKRSERTTPARNVAEVLAQHMTASPIGEKQ